MPFGFDAMPDRATSPETRRLLLNVAAQIDRLVSSVGRQKRVEPIDRRPSPRIDRAGPWKPQKNHPPRASEAEKWSFALSTSAPGGSSR
jgi:hypothetical protein